MLEFSNDSGWFQVVAENEDEDLRGWYRRFVVVRLTPEQIAEECRWHDLFREHVGWHNDYIKDVPSRYEGLRPREQWQAFYEPYKKRVPLDLSRNEVLAWFEHWERPCGCRLSTHCKGPAGRNAPCDSNAAWRTAGR